MITAIISALGIGIIALGALLVLRLFRKKDRPQRATWRDLGSVLDRAITTYRRHLAPALALSALCVLLGSSTGFSLQVLIGLLAQIDPNETTIFFSTPLTALWLVGFFGIGNTLLACGVAQLAYQPPTPLRSRWRDVLGLTLLLAPPALLSQFLGVIGGLLSIIWATAPAALVFEQQSPWGAFKRSTQFARSNYSLLLNTIVLLALIGWLIVGTAIVFSSWVLTNLLGAQPPVISAVVAAEWLCGQIFVSPLIAFGVATCYTFMHERASTMQPQVA